MFMGREGIFLNGQQCCVVLIGKDKRCAGIHYRLFDTFDFSVYNGFVHLILLVIVAHRL